MKSHSRSSRVAVVFGTTIMPLAILIASTTRCYAPTEVTVDLSTDLKCVPVPHTAIFKGEPFGTAPEAETSNCTPAVGGGGLLGADAKIGSLVFVPSGSVNGRAAVKAILAIGEKSPASCEANPENCIFATRSFSYVAHTSRRIPIRMLEECIGQRCPDGFTCVSRGRCGSNQDVCEREPTRPECAQVVPPIEGGPPPFDGGGGLDAPDDGPKTPPCPSLANAPNGVLHMQSSMPTLAASSPTTLFWTSISAGTLTGLYSIPKMGGVPPTLIDQKGGLEDPITALGVDGEVAIFGHGQGFNSWGVTVAGNMPTLYPFPAPPTAVIRADGFMFAGTATDNFSFKNGQFVSRMPKFGVTSFAYSAKDGVFFAAATNGVYAYNTKQVGPGEPNFTLVGNSSPRNAFLISNPAGTVFGAPRGAVGQDLPVQRVVLNTSIVMPNVVVNPPTSLAADDTHVYGVQNGNQLARWSLSSTAGDKAEPMMATVEGTLDHIAVDALCIYYWLQRTDGDVQTAVTLNVMSKEPKKIDGGK